MKREMGGIELNLCATYLKFNIIRVSVVSKISRSVCKLAM